MDCLVSLSFPEKPRMCGGKWGRMAFSYPRKTASLTKSYQVLVLRGVPRKGNWEWLGMLGGGVLLMPS